MFDVRSEGLYAIYVIVCKYNILLTKHYMERLNSLDTIVLQAEAHHDYT